MSRNDARSSRANGELGSLRMHLDKADMILRWVAPAIYLDLHDVLDFKAQHIFVLMKLSCPVLRLLPLNCAGALNDLENEHRPENSSSRLVTTTC